MKTLLCAIFLIGCAAGLSEDPKYVGAQVFRVTPQTFSQLQYLKAIQRSNKYDFWTEPAAIGKPVDIMATRWHVPTLKATLFKAHIKHEIIIHELYNLILHNRVENDLALDKLHKEGKAMDWTAYHEYNEIMAWVDSLPATYPSLVTVEDVGTSYEGRTMKIVKVSTGGSGKPAIFSDGGMHAREWISPATLTYIMNELLSNSAAYSDVLDLVDFYFMPVINPDGYAYTFSDDRLWRKTRTPQGTCYGVDPNRNWDFHWMESGSSSVACAETFAGPEPFSEPEMVVVRDQMLKYAANIPVYLTFHSYSQVWIYPWGYDSVLPPDWQDLDTLANSAVDALTAVHGTVYEVGASGTLLYPASGASDDYSKGVAGIKYAYTIELRDTGTFGFQLPPGQIIPCGEETFAGFQVVMNFVRDNYGKK